MASLFLTSFALSAEPCRVEPHAKILKINKVLDSSLIKNTNCDDKTVNVITKFLSGASGSMRGKHLSRMFKNEYELDIEFTSDVEIHDLKDFISERLELKDTVITRLTSLYGQASLNLEGGENLSVECPSCIEPGDRNIKLKINRKTIWLGSEIKIRRFGYRLLKDVSPFSSDFGPALVEETTSLDDGKAMMFRDLERLRFFKPNKPLARGQTLKQSDLTPKTLVKFNQNVDVILKGKNISLKTKATSRQNGRYGDMVKLYNPKAQKNILGTVIDFNTVMVEL